MTVTEALASGPGSSVPEAGGHAVTTQARNKGLRRAVRPALAMAPFVIYTVLGLGIPTLAVIEEAFRSDTGKLTLANVHTVMHGTYRLGFLNSILLAAITSVVPGILGVFLAYAIETSRSGVLRRLVATASGVLANFGGINLTFMFIATLGSTGVLTAWLSVAHLNPWNHGFNLYSFYGVAFYLIFGRGWLALGVYWAWWMGTGGTAVPDEVVKAQADALDGLKEIVKGDETIGTEADPATTLGVKVRSIDAAGTRILRKNMGGFC